MQTVTINGRLTYKTDASTPLKLSAEHVLVRSGELIIGTKDAPFTNQAILNLQGDAQADTIVLSAAIEAGNRILMNIANVSMYGAARDGFSRLYSEALAGSQQFNVAPGLDWKQGDFIALAPTSFSALHHEKAEILNYNSISGLLTVAAPLKFYHWGQAESTVAEYSSDIRGEVLMLTRNIVVTGNECTILTSNYIEFDLSVRSGLTIMDQVEIRDCSQENTHKSALRFENNHGTVSSITNSALHNGGGWGFNLNGVSNLIVKNNVLYNFKNFGINVQIANDVTIDGNVVSAILERRGFIMNQGVPDVWAGIAVCTYRSGKVCPGMRVNNNVVAGATYIGITALGHRCGEAATQQKFRNNTVHSVKWEQMGFGHGVIVINDVSDPFQVGAGSCFEASSFTTYKCTTVGMTGGLFMQTERVIFSNNIAIDSVGGITPANLNTAYTYRRVTPTIEIRDNILVGES